MSQVAENVIPVPEVIEHFGDVRKVLARLMKKTVPATYGDLLEVQRECAEASWKLQGTKAGRLYNHALRDIDRAQFLLANDPKCGVRSKAAAAEALVSVQTARDFAASAL